MAKSATTKRLFQATGNVGLYTTTEMTVDALSSATVIDGRPLIAYAIDPDNPYEIWLATEEPSSADYADLQWHVFTHD